MMNRMRQCADFLTKNGWELDKQEGCYWKKDHYAVCVNHDELVFIDDTGDFLHKPTDLMTLIGVLVYNRQLDMSFHQ